MITDDNCHEIDIKKVIRMQKPEINSLTWGMDANSILTIIDRMSWELDIPISESRKKNIAVRIGWLCVFAGRSIYHQEKQGYEITLFKQQK